MGGGLEVGRAHRGKDVSRLEAASAKEPADVFCDTTTSSPDNQLVDNG